MTKLTDLQSMLLSTVAQRESDSVLPAHEGVAGAGTRLTRRWRRWGRPASLKTIRPATQAMINRTGGYIGYDGTISVAD